MIFDRLNTLGVIVARTVDPARDGGHAQLIVGHRNQQRLERVAVSIAGIEPAIKILGVQ